jgi:hypothetical protein
MYHGKQPEDIKTYKARGFNFLLGLKTRKFKGGERGAREGGQKYNSFYIDIFTAYFQEKFFTKGF